MLKLVVERVELFQQDFAVIDTVVLLSREACAKTRGKTITKNMVDYMDEIIAFLLQLPAELEVVRQSVCFTNDLNLLEYWYRRLE